MKRLIPFIAIFVICLITFSLWILSKQNPSLIFEQPLRSLSQILALLGTVIMSFTILLSTRLKWVEKIFNGLDKAYGFHQILGSISFLFILHHPILLAIQSLPQVQLVMLYLLPSSDLAYSLGVFGLYLMIVSFLFMTFIKLPYHLWKLTHKLLGLGFLLGGVHALFITSDISNFLPLRLWITGFLALGISSLLYRILLYTLFGPKYNYSVEKVERGIGVVTVYLKPKAKEKLDFKPGQFAYVSFRNKITGSESHPFSIASGPKEKFLKLSAKIVGDYTLKLTQLREGDKVLLYGPYGKFTMNRFNYKNCLWIAGGIGVTPFLSMLSSEAYQCSNNSICFYYTYGKKDEGNFVDEINTLITRAPNVKFYDWCSREKSRLDLKEIMSKINIRVLDAIFMCGPSPMMEGFKKQFLQAGIPEQKIIYENFNFL